MNKPRYSQSCSHKNTCVIVEGITRHLEHINLVLPCLKFSFFKFGNQSKLFVPPGSISSTFKQHLRYHFLPEQVDSCHVIYLTEVALLTHCRLLSTGVMSTKSYQQSTSKHGKNSFSVLPEIVANYKTTMCNPYEKRKVTTNRSKIPVPKISTNGKSRGVVLTPVKAAKQAPFSKSTGLPAGFFGPAKTELATFKIPKLKRSGCDTMNNSSSTKYPKNMSRMTDRSSRKPTTYVPKVSQSSKQGPHTTTTNPKRSVLKTAKIAATTTVTVNRPQQVQKRQGPWPYGIPPCSRYTVKWGDPAYTGSYVEGEWCYDVVGALPRPMGWPDMSDMFPDIPKGIFELRSVEPCAVPSQLSSAEGTKKLRMIAFHLISSRPAMEVKLTEYSRCKFELLNCLKNIC